MTRSLDGRARPAVFLLTLLLTVACTAGPTAAQSPTGGPSSAANASTPASPVAPATPTVPAPGAGSGRVPGTEPGGTGGSGTVGTEPGGPPSGPDTPIGGVPGGPPTDPDSGWKLIGVTPGLTNLHPQAFDHISVSADGKTVTIYFWGGVEACFGLAEVRVTRQGGVPVITVITGTPDLPANTACIEIAQAFRTVITLDEPLILDGSQNDAPHE